MINLLLVSSDNDSLATLAAALAKHNDVHVMQEQSGAAALKKVTGQNDDPNYDLIITDENLNDMAGLDLAEKVVKINPLINCAAVSSLSEDDFHEASEGLGLMAHLPVHPKEAHAEEILERLREIIHLTGG